MDKKEKKALIRARNKRTQLTQKHIDQHQQSTHDAMAAQQEMLEEQARQAAERTEPDTVVWSAQTQMIRNRITNKRRKSMDRWNRFAGTSGGGGMGL